MNKSIGLLMLLVIFQAATMETTAQPFSYQEAGTRYLVLDKPGKVKRIRFYVGDKLTFRLKGDKVRYNAEITNILPSAVVFGDAVIPLDEFKKIHYTKRSYWAQMARGASESGKVTGIAFTSLGMVGTLAAPENRNAQSLCWGGLGILGTSQLIKLFYLRTYRLNSFRRLQILEIPNAEFVHQEEK